VESIKMKLVLMLSLVLLAGCTAAPAASVSGIASGDVYQLPSAGGTTVHRVHDREKGVLCYVSDGYKSGGISCIEIKP
jgi:hypothetical protein